MDNSIFSGKRYFVVFGLILVWSILFSCKSVRSVSPEKSVCHPVSDLISERLTGTVLNSGCGWIIISKSGDVLFHLKPCNLKNELQKDKMKIIFDYKEIGLFYDTNCDATKEIMLHYQESID